jgi:hypothetical protein
MGQDKGAACDAQAERYVNLLQQGSAVPYNWFLPVISGFEISSFLMTDKHQSTVCTSRTASSQSRAGTL